MLKKRTPAEWEDIIGIKIIIPNGWHYGYGQLKPKPYHEPISRREFHRRMVYSETERK